MIMSTHDSIMRPQTKDMLQLLRREGMVTDREAEGAGIINPRREAGLLKHRQGFDLTILKHSYAKREYQLLEQ